MKNISKYIILSLVTLLVVSCKEEKEKPKVIYGKSETPKAEIKEDTSKISVADLPIQMPGTSVLIHPIGALSVSEGRESKLASSSSDRNQSFIVSNSNVNDCFLFVLTFILFLSLIIKLLIILICSFNSLHCNIIK
jgi:NAD-dependent SIR2 family protein deacetylase